MYSLVIHGQEFFDENTSTIYTVKDTTLNLEHSLVSVRKWESRWKKPFISSEEKTVTEIIDYIRCMTLTQNVNPLVYELITADNISEIMKYIDDPMTATWFSDENKKKKTGEVMTAERIYYLMFSLNIPIECQKWHLNQLITLIKVFDAENAPKKKMTKEEIFARNRALNAQRKAKLHTKG